MPVKEGLRRYRDLNALTPGEQRIWDLYKQGKSPAEIARELGIGRQPTNQTVNRVKEKLGLFEKAV